VTACRIALDIEFRVAVMHDIAEIMPELILIKQSKSKTISHRLLI
jgi:hypothetical protein